MLKTAQAKFIFSLITVFLFLLLTQHIRFLDYATVPEPFLVLDEKTDIMYGLSLRQTGVPAAWSDLRSYWEIWAKVKDAVQQKGIGYSNFNVTLGREKPTISNHPALVIHNGEFDFGRGVSHTLIVQPYLDHPPFGSLVLSSLVSPNVKTFTDLKLTDFRRSAVVLTYVTAILLFILGFQLFKNPVPGILAAVVYASVPTFVFISRMAFLENVLVPIQLIVLNLMLFRENKKLSKNVDLFLLILAGVFSGLGILTKTVGVAIVVATVIYLIVIKAHKKLILFYAVPVVLVGSIYFIWGLFLSPNLFLEILKEQSTRRIFIGSLNFILDFIKFGLVNFPIDGWWIGGFISLLFIKPVRENYLFLVSLVVMFFTIFFTGATNFAWYIVPIVPFMSIGVGYLLWQITVNPSPKQILIFFLLFFSSSFFWGWGVNFAAPNFNNHQLGFSVYKILMVLFFMAAFFGQKIITKNKNIWTFSVYIVVIVAVVLNFQSIIFMVNHWGNLSNYYLTNWQL